MINFLMRSVKINFKRHRNGRSFLVNQSTPGNVTMKKLNASSVETRRRLIEAATRLFADDGFRAVSTRDIARAAGVNPALINYHFGSKEGIFEEVIRSSAAEHVADRMHQLTRARTGNKKLDLSEILSIYLEPLVNSPKWASGQNNFPKLHAALVNERSEVAEDIAVRAFNTVNVAFIDELASCLPHLERDVIVWRFYAMIGTLLFFEIRGGPPGFDSATSGRCNASDPKEVLAQLLPFFEAGMLAPMPYEEADEQEAKSRKA